MASDKGGTLELKHSLEGGKYGIGLVCKDKDGSCCAEYNNYWFNIEDKTTGAQVAGGTIAGSDANFSVNGSMNVERSFRVSAPSTTSSELIVMFIGLPGYSDNLRTGQLYVQNGYLRIKT